MILILGSTEQRPASRRARTIRAIMPSARQVLGPAVGCVLAHEPHAFCHSMDFFTYEGGGRRAVPRCRTRIGHDRYLCAPDLPILSHEPNRKDPCRNVPAQSRGLPPPATCPRFGNQTPPPFSQGKRNRNRIRAKIPAGKILYFDKWMGKSGKYFYHARPRHLSRRRGLPRRRPRSSPRRHAVYMRPLRARPLLQPRKLPLLMPPTLCCSSSPFRQFGFGFLPARARRRSPFPIRSDDDDAPPP